MRYPCVHISWPAGATEMHATMEAAIRREQQIKKWDRAWKIELIERSNRRWHGLYETILDGARGAMDSRFPPE
jgi:putative endonuclease